MAAERTTYMNAQPYARNEERIAHANGYKTRKLKTRIGELNLSIPQVREGGFYPKSIEKGVRSEKALTIAMAEMYVQGVSTRKVSDLIETIFGCEVSSATVSKAAQDLDEVLEDWRNSPLGETKYLYLDARYEKVRTNGYYRDAAILIATGVLADGHRKILGTSISLGEQEPHWRQFLQSLVNRGLRGVALIISDDHSGLKAARKAVFGGVKWQRCQFHLQQNAQAYVPRKAMQTEVSDDIRTIFNAPDRDDAEMYLAKFVAKYEKLAPNLAAWMEENIPEGLTCFDFPVQHRKYIRTNNTTERLNREIRRRTRVAGIFPNEASCLRLISAVLMEITEEWEAGKKYLNMQL